jgi:hypothetical protein
LQRNPDDRPEDARTTPNGADVPALVRSYVERVLPTTRARRRMQLTQSGVLRLKPGARWLPFTAIQESSLQEIAFSWRARMRMLPLLPVYVLDRYAAGVGTGEVRLFGRIPIMRESGRQVGEGSALRYLAELPWAPQAMLANGQLEWRDVDAKTVEVATQLASTRVCVQFRFDGAGNIVGGWTESRPHKEEGRYVPRAWGGVYSDYGVLGGIEIPTRAEVTWQLPGGPFTWFRGTITSLEARP